jgi:hypothetical protein
MTVLAATLVLTMAAFGSQAGVRASCEGPEYRLLDFWVGTWDVHLAGEPGKKVGANVIEKTLGGCAIFEHWDDVLGGAGKSLFYFHRADNVWKQVWVTDVGRVKEKHATELQASGAVRFQGALRLDDGGRMLDRTTLIPLPDGRVRQHIEQSTDDGVTWVTTFDAVYTKRR